METITSGGFIVKFHVRGGVTALQAAVAEVALHAAKVRKEDAKLAQKLGQLQPFIAMYSHRNAWTNLHLFQPI
jgi:hypothetical protein